MGKGTGSVFIFERFRISIAVFTTARLVVLENACELGARIIASTPLQVTSTRHHETEEVHVTTVVVY